MSYTDFGKIAKAKNQIIRITHVATASVVEFPAFLTDFQDSYSVTWGNEQIYGRNDPVKPYSATGRTIKIGFSVLSPNFRLAKENLDKFAILTKMLYPVYSEKLAKGFNSGRTIQGPPLVRIKFVNFITTPLGGGLLGCIDGVSLNPDKEMGFFDEKSGNLYPKGFDIDLNFTPQHEQELGWKSADKNFITDRFPYGSDTNSRRTGATSQISSATADDLLNGS